MSEIRRYSRDLQCKHLSRSRAATPSDNTSPLHSLRRGERFISAFLSYKAVTRWAILTVGSNHRTRPRLTPPRPASRLAPGASRASPQPSHFLAAGPNPAPTPCLGPAPRLPLAARWCHTCRSWRRARSGAAGAAFAPRSPSPSSFPRQPPQPAARAPEPLLPRPSASHWRKPPSVKLACQRRFAVCSPRPAHPLSGGAPAVRAALRAVPRLALGGRWSPRGCGRLRPAAPSAAAAAAGSDADARRGEVGAAPLSRSARGLRRPRVPFRALCGWQQGPLSRQPPPRRYSAQPTSPPPRPAFGRRRLGARGVTAAQRGGAGSPAQVRGWCRLWWGEGGRGGLPGRWDAPGGCGEGPGRAAASPVAPPAGCCGTAAAPLTLGAPLFENRAAARWRLASGGCPGSALVAPLSALQAAGSRPGRSDVLMRLTYFVSSVPAAAGEGEAGLSLALQR